ncbi:MAG: TorF family putative porin [Pseudomonadota bacterium]
MLTSIRGLTAASLSAGLLFTAAPAFAAESSDKESISEELIAATVAIDNEATNENETVLNTRVEGISVERAGEPIDENKANDVGGEGPFSFSANITFATEYRFRGVDLSGGDFAVQGGFDVGLPAGFYVGTWASNLDEDTVGFGSTELDIYGGWSGDLGGLSADIGVIGYLYPDAPTAASPTDYVEFYGSLSGEIGPGSLTAGIAYAPDQDSLGSTDNLYIYGDLSVGIPDTPLSLNAHLGYTDGFLTFTDDSKAFDWSVSADLSAGPLTFSGAYIGVEGDELVDPGRVFTDDTFVLSVSASF